LTRDDHQSPKKSVCPKFFLQKKHFSSLFAAEKLLREQKKFVNSQNRPKLSRKRKMKV
jgi:hypothetical protein